MRRYFQICFPPIANILISVPPKLLYCITYFEREYERRAIEVSINSLNENNYDIVVHLDKKVPSGYQVQKQIIGKVFPLQFAWRFYKSNRSNVVMYYKSNYFKYILPLYIPINLQTYLLEPLIYYIGFQKGYTLLHAGSTEKDCSGTVVMAESGCGKTSLIIKFLDNGYKFMGDDLVWVSKDLTLIRYPRKIHLFSYVVKNNSKLRLTQKLKIILTFKDILRKVIEFILQERFHIATRESIEKVVDNVQVSEVTKLVNLVYLVKYSAYKAFRISKFSCEKYLDEMLETIEPMENLFDNFLVGDNKSKNEIYEKQKRYLKHIISNVNTVVVNRELVKTEIKNLKRLLNE